MDEINMEQILIEKQLYLVEQQLKLLCKQGVLVELQTKLALGQLNNKEDK